MLLPIRRYLGLFALQLLPSLLIGQKFASFLYFGLLAVSTVYLGAKRQDIPDVSASTAAVVRRRMERGGRWFRIHQQLCFENCGLFICIVNSCCLHPDGDNELFPTAFSTLFKTLLLWIPIAKLLELCTPLLLCCPRVR